MRSKEAIDINTAKTIQNLKGSPLAAGFCTCSGDGKTKAFGRVVVRGLTYVPNTIMLLLYVQ